RDTGREISERASDYYQTGVERASDMTSRGKEAVSELTDRGKDLINRQKSQFAAAIEAGKQGYREAKQADPGKGSAAVEESELVGGWRLVVGGWWFRRRLAAIHQPPSANSRSEQWKAL